MPFWQTALVGYILPPQRRRPNLFFYFFSIFWEKWDHSSEFQNKIFTPDEVYWPRRYVETSVPIKIRKYLYFPVSLRAEVTNCRSVNCTIGHLSRVRFYCVRGFFTVGKLTIRKNVSFG